MSAVEIELRLANLERELRHLNIAIDNLAKPPVHARTCMGCSHPITSCSCFVHWSPEIVVLRQLGEAVSEYFFAKHMFLEASDEDARCAAHLDRTVAKNRCVALLQQWRRSP